MVRIQLLSTQIYFNQIFFRMNHEKSVAKKCRIGLIDFWKFIFVKLKMMILHSNLE